MSLRTATDVAKAVVEKPPLANQNTLQAIPGHMAQLMPKLRPIQEETLSKLNATK
jgi:hypothetical protein